MDVEFIKVPKYVSYKADLLCISLMYSQFNGKFSNDICFHFWCYWLHFTKDTCRTRRGNVNSTELANPVTIKFFPRNIMRLTLHSGSHKNKLLLPQKLHLLLSKLTLLIRKVLGKF